MTWEIRLAESERDLVRVRVLFEQYADFLAGDVCLQGLDEESIELPGRYGPPAGRLLVAVGSDGQPLGCGGFRPMSSSVCEMKRLFVAPEGRGLGIGLALMKRLIAEAQAEGYQEMWLDTLPRMAAAIAMYEREGFTPIAPFGDTAAAEVLYFGKRLV